MIVPISLLREEATRTPIRESACGLLWDDLVHGRLESARARAHEWCVRLNYARPAEEWLWQHRLADLAKPAALSGPVPVSIEHDGAIVLVDGHNRTARRVAEGATSIEVTVERVHPSWARLVMLLRQQYQNADRVYVEVEHPYFDSWEVIRPGRRVMIADYLTRALAQRRVLPGQNAGDYGCLTGGMTRDLARLGFCAIGFDRDPALMEVAAHLDLVFGTRCTFRRMDFLEDGAAENPLHAGIRFGPVLVMSLLHHWLGPRPSVALALLRSLAHRSVVVLVDLPNDEDCHRLGIPQSIADVQAAYTTAMLGRTPEMLGEHQSRVTLAYWLPNATR